MYKHDIEWVLRAAKNSGNRWDESDVENIVWASECQNETSENGFAIASWSDSNVMSRLETILETLGVQCLPKDGYDVCGGCYKAIETEPTCMSWTPRYVVAHGDYLCEECAADDHDVIRAEIADGARLSWFPYEALGYTLADEDTDVYLHAVDIEEKDGSLAVRTGSCYSYDVWRPEGHAARAAAEAEAFAKAAFDKATEEPITAEDYRYAREDYAGWCVVCKYWTRDSDTEPDAHGYRCPVCERDTCCGAEDALMRGYIAVTED